MKKTLKYWQIAGFIFTGIMGVILHFLFDWTNKSTFASLFSAVNESIWEHMKLVFFPMFLFSLLQNRYIGKEYSDFWCIKLLCIVAGTVLIPVMYYTLSGIVGRLPDWVNIVIFFTTVLITYYVEAQLFMKNGVKCESPKWALITLCLIALVFAVMTFLPPDIPLFKDPITGKYGLT